MLKMCSRNGTSQLLRPWLLTLQGLRSAGQWERADGRRWGDTQAETKAASLEPCGQHNETHTHTPQTYSRHSWQIRVLLKPWGRLKHGATHADWDCRLMPRAHLQKRVYEHKRKKWQTMRFSWCWIKYRRKGSLFPEILHTMFPYILGLQCQNWDCDNLINFFFTCTILNSLSLSFQIFTSVMQYKPEERLQIRVIFIQNCKTLYKENGLVK